MATLQFLPVSLERMYAPMERVRDRVRRAAAALEKAKVPYAVVGGNAVAAWVTRVDPSAVRATQDVDILINRTDLDAAKAAMSAVGFVYRHAAGIDMFLEGPDGRARDAVHILFASEKVRPEYLIPTPAIDESQSGDEFRYLTLDALVRMKLTSFRRKDQVHIEDMIDVGLIDATWLAKLPPELGARLKEILDTPGG
jgi:hypothetical protein